VAGCCEYGDESEKLWRHGVSDSALLSISEVREPKFSAVSQFPWIVSCVIYLFNWLICNILLW